MEPWQGLPRAVADPLPWQTPPTGFDGPKQQERPFTMDGRIRQEELTAAAELLATASPYEVLAWAARRFGPRLTMATAFGAEGCCLIHLLAEIAELADEIDVQRAERALERAKSEADAAAERRADVRLRAVAGH